jgi:hypothetical protein
VAQRDILSPTVRMPVGLQVSDQHSWDGVIGTERYRRHSVEYVSLVDPPSLTVFAVPAYPVKKLSRMVW